MARRGKPIVQRATVTMAMFAIVGVLFVAGCGSSGSDSKESSSDDAVATDETSDEPTSEESADEEGDEPQAAAIPDEDLAQIDYGAAMLTGEEVSSFFDVADTQPLEAQEAFDLAGEIAHNPCEYAPEDLVAVAGTGQEHRNDGSLSVTQYLGSYSADGVDDAWAKLQDAADLDGKCVDFDDGSGGTNTVDGTETVRQVFQAEHGLDVTTDDNLLITQFETPSGTKVLDVVVRSGQIVGQIRVVYTGAVTEQEANTAAAAFVEQFRQAYEG